MKILIGINTLSTIHNNAYASHLNLFHRIGKKHPDWTVMLFAPLRMGIDRMRNTAAKIALENGCDFILFIDDDVLVPPDTLDILLEAKADVAAGWTVIRGYPFNNMFFKWTDESTLEPYNDFEQPADGILPVGAVGFSCCLLSVAALRLVEAPYFITGTRSTEDVYYCVKLQHFKADARIVVCLNLETGHMMEPLIVEPRNRLKLKRDAEEQYPEFLTMESNNQTNGPVTSYEELVRKEVCE